MGHSIGDLHLTKHQLVLLDLLTSVARFCNSYPFNLSSIGWPLTWGFWALYIVTKRHGEKDGDRDKALS